MLVEVKDERWLIYRRWLGPKYGGAIEETRRLVRVQQATDFVVAGSYGDDKPLYLSYSHRPGGITVLEVNSASGAVTKSQVFGE